MRSLPVICVALLALLLGSALASADVYPGSYDAKAKGLTVKLDVGDRASSIAYAMKSECGASKSKIELSKAGAGLKGHRVSRGPESTLRTAVAKVALSGDGKQLVGTIKESLKGGDSELSGCHAKRSFSVGVEQADGFVPTRDLGHYSGTAKNGLPISFDVVTEGDDVQIENLAVDVQADCYDDSDPDADEFSTTTHITGMSGEVDKDGTFYIDYAPDDDTEYEFDGELADGAAKVDVIVGGLFDAAGNPSATGPYACDSWGDLYAADAA